MDLGNSHIKEATIQDVDLIVKFLSEMQQELDEFAFIPEVVRQSVSESFSEGVHWFIFLDESQTPIGTCYMQTVHNYWRAGKRFYRGGFYITPEKRGQGRYKQLNSLLMDWAKDRNGVQIYGHIHKDNSKSLSAAASVRMEPTDYRLCVNHWGEE